MKEKLDKKARRKERKKRKLEAAIEEDKHVDDDLDELERDARLVKKLKRGKVRY